MYIKESYNQLFKMIRIYMAYRRRKSHCGFPPSRLWIELTNQCNLGCIMCLNKNLSSDSFGYMDFDLYKKIIDEISGKVYDIYLHHRGESLLHPQFFDMVRYAKSYGIYTRLHTNATLLNEERSHRVIDSGLDFISFSFDGYEKITYESIRQGASFEKVLSNIINFLKIKKSRRSKNPFTAFTVIEFQNKDVDNNLKKDFLRNFRDLPLDAIRIRRPHNWGGDYRPGGINACKGFGMGFQPCTFLWYSLTIFWDGTVIPCPQDFFGNLKIGNVRYNSLMELWNSKDEVFLRDIMRIKDYQGIKPCNNCDRIWRRNILGIPLDEISSFLRDNLLGYKG